MDASTFNRYSRSLVGCMDESAGKRMNDLYTYDRHTAKILQLNNGIFTTPLGHIDLIANPNLKKEVDELEEFLED